MTAKKSKTRRRRELRERAAAAKLNEARQGIAVAAAPADHRESNPGGQGAALEPRTEPRTEPRSLSQLDHQAVARGWLTAAAPEKLAAVLNRQVMIAIDPKRDARDSSRAANVVVKAVGQVMEQEKRESGVSDQPTINVAVAVDARPANQSIREVIDHDPNYALYLEQRELGQSAQHGDMGANGHAALVGSNGLTGGIHGPAAHSGAQPGGNGHANGNGWHPSSDGDDAAAAREK